MIKMSKAKTVDRNSDNSEEENIDTEMPKSMTMLADYLRSSGIEQSENQILLLANALDNIPDANGIRDKIEELLVESIRTTRKANGSAVNLYMLCTGVISGANTVIQAIYISSEGA